MVSLVTGAAGFIGSTLCERLLKDGETVIGVDCFTSYYDVSIKKQNLSAATQHEKFTFIEADLSATNLSEILSTVECVYHTAGQPGVRGSWGQQFDTYANNNIMATQRLLEQIKTVNPGIRLVYSSSSSIYGNSRDLPLKETSLPKPYSPYGTTKLAAEHLCHLYFENYKIPVVSLRYFTVYGPRQRPDMAFHIFLKSLRNDEPITILGDGSQTRDFTYVDDIVAGNILAAQKPVEGHVFNLGGGCRVSVNYVLELLEEISGKTPTIEKKAKMQGDVRDTWADTTLAQQHLGYAPNVSLKEGLKNEYHWVEQQYS